MRNFHLALILALSFAPVIGSAAPTNFSAPHTPTKGDAVATTLNALIQSDGTRNVFVLWKAGTKRFSLYQIMPRDSAPELVEATARAWGEESPGLRKLLPLVEQVLGFAPTTDDFDVLVVKDDFDGPILLSWTKGTIKR